MSKIKLYIDFDDVVVSTRPRLEEQLKKAYKWASSEYWDKKIDDLTESYNISLNNIKEKEKSLMSLYSGTVLRSCLDKLYASEMQLRADYIFKLRELKENAKYFGVNLDYVLEVLNNSCYYQDGDNPNSPYYIDYEKILDLNYAIDDSLDFLKEVSECPWINPEIISHKNCVRESARKIEMRSYICDIPIHLLDFHSDPFSTGPRVINSKADYVMNLHGIDHLDDSFILIDDSKTNIKDWILKGGKGILFSPKLCDEFPYQMMRMSFDEFKNCLGGKQKRLIKRSKG